MSVGLVVGYPFARYMLLLTAPACAVVPQSASVSVELSFGEAMSSRERRSLSRQLVRAYGANRGAPHPLRLSFSALDEASLHPDMLHRDLARWDCQRVGERADVRWPADELVWLSPDAGEPLSTLDPDVTYVVSGLVDRSVVSGRSLERSRAAGGRAVRLPLRECAPRPDVHPILSVVSVVSMLAAVNSGASWEEAIGAALPKRFMERREAEAAARGEGAGGGRLV